MNIEDFVKLEITYKPGWGIRILPITSAVWNLEVIYTAVDVQSGKTIHLSAQRPFTAAEILSCDRSRIIKTIFEHVLTMETHEAEEWFKIDGENIYNPHAAHFGWRPVSDANDLKHG